MDSKTAIRQLKELERQGGATTMRLAAEGWKEEWQTLIAILMSARTRDETTIIVAKNLFAEYKTPEELGKANPKDIARIVGPLNFFQNKTRFVIACATALAKEYNGKPPHDFSKLVELAGVGRKTANVFLAEYGTDAVGVDTHVSYISQKLGWTAHKDPQKIEQDLLALFPREYWRVINRTLVRFGKTNTSRMKKDEILKKIRDF